VNNGSIVCVLGQLAVCSGHGELGKAGYRRLESGEAGVKGSGQSEVGGEGVIYSFQLERIVTAPALTVARAISASSRGGHY
jgi:hypothetical protein